MLFPQFAPKAVNPSPDNSCANCVPVTPIMVRPLVSKLIVAVMATSAQLGQGARAVDGGLNLVEDVMVSIQSRSAPPSTSPRACSAKAARIRRRSWRRSARELARRTDRDRDQRGRPASSTTAGLRRGPVDLDDRSCTWWSFNR